MKQLAFCYKKSLLLLLLISAIPCAAKMTMYKYFEEHWRIDAIQTEVLAYLELEKNPLDADAVCVAIPWAVIINYNMYDQLPNIRFEGEKIFTICQHDHVKNIIPYAKKMGIKVVFACSTPNNETFGNLALVPMLQQATNGTDPVDNKDIFYSFVGTVWTFPVRQELMNLPLYPDVYMKAREQWHYYLPLSERRESEMREYKDVLSRSIFALCPRGVGLSTIRFSEALQAGAIPVIFDPTWQLPYNFDWENTIVFVDRKDLPNLYQILKAIPADRIALMRDNCRKAYNRFCNGTLSNPVREYYDGVKN